MPLKILQLGPYPPPEGGVTRNLIAIRDAVRAEGGNCPVISTTRSTRSQGVDDVTFPESATQLISTLRRAQFDVLHLHIGGELTRRVMGLMAAATFFAGKRSVLTVHSGAYPLTPAAVGASPNSISGINFRRFGRIIAVNDQLKDVFVRFGVPENSIRVVSPFSLTRPDPAVTIPPEFETFPLVHRPFLISVGGLEADYDPLLQIEAMELAWRSLPDAGLMLVGGGSLEAEVRAAAARCSRPEKILVAGNIEHGVTLHLIDRADVLLRVTRFDGDAISVREALHLGTPVIATDNGMRPEGTRLIGIGDGEGLARKILEIAKAPPEGTAHTAPAAADNIEKVIELYREIIEAEL